MPTNLYGPNDNYDLGNSHVLPALLRKFHEAKAEGRHQVVVWGSGTPKREFLHADDLARACLFLMENYSEPGLINIGTGVDLSIRELAEMMARVTGFTGEIVWDSSKPDGTPRKLMDVSRIHSLGWHHEIELEEGIRSVYQELEAGAFASLQK
jgi:GDP-L-fucose synthase